MLVPSGLPSLIASGVAAVAASRRLDFNESRGLEAGAQTETQQPQIDQHQASLATLRLCSFCIAHSIQGIGPIVRIIFNRGMRTLQASFKRSCSFQVDPGWALHVPCGGGGPGLQGVLTPVSVPRDTRASTTAVKLEEKMQQPVQGVEIVDLVTPPARLPGTVIDEIVDLTADSPPDVISI